MQHGNGPSSASVVLTDFICHLVVKELRSLKQEKQQLQQKCELQEQTLQEMGLHLSQSVPLSLLLTSTPSLLLFTVLPVFFF